MALLFTEGFDWTTNAGDYITYGKWTDSSSVGINSTGSLLRWGSGNGLGLNNGGSATGGIRRAIGQNLAAGVIGFAVRIDFNGSGQKAPILHLFDTTTSCQMGLQLNNDLTISIFRGSNANILGTTTATITTGVYTYLELKWKIASSIGGSDVILYLNGTAVLTLASTTNTQATGNAYATHYSLGAGPNAPSISGAFGYGIYWDDHYLLDLTGSVNNAHLGDCRVVTLLPSGNGNTSGMTNTAGNSTNNSTYVDDTSPNGDTDYVESATATTKDTYAFQDLPGTTNTVYGVVNHMIARRTDTTAKTICPVSRISGTDYDGTTSATLPTSYTDISTVMETSPATSIAWTPTEINGAEFGVKVVS